jgi:hypothetical protein
MSRRLAIAACLGAFALPASAPADPMPDQPSRLLVTAREYSLTLSRPKLPAGRSIVQLHNFGEDPHDLHLQRKGANRVYEVGEVAPGETAALDLKLRRRSTYRLWCSIEPHASLGMVTALKTRAKRPRAR